MDEDQISAEDRNAVDDARWDKLWGQCNEIAAKDESVSEIDLLNTMQQHGMVDPNEAYQKLKGNPVTTQDQQNIAPTFSSDFARDMHTRLSQTQVKPESEITTGNLKDRMSEFLKKRQDERG